MSERDEWCGVNLSGWVSIEEGSWQSIFPSQECPACGLEHPGLPCQQPDLFGDQPALIGDDDE